ncbi:MAG: DNA primase [Thermoanaerobaculia bacterium]|nr:DNA primase [Thermoanaerobaculia bacterium]
MRHLDFLAHALAYALAGWLVLALRPRGKEPLTPHGVKDATSNAQVIQSWGARWSDANIGIAIPDGYAVLDIDSQDALLRLRAEGRELPATVQMRTARGAQFWYRTEGQVRNRVGILPAIDVRAAGGYVVVPPSIHPTGVVYEWVVPLERDAIAPAPAWLLSLLREADRSSHRSAESWALTIAQPVAPGRRNQALAEVTGLLFRKLPAAVAAELAQCWARVRLVPPLPDAEVQRTIDSIAGRELRRRGGAR